MADEEWQSASVQHATKGERRAQAQPFSLPSYDTIPFHCTPSEWIPE